jgi:hypothetical protein
LRRAVAAAAIALSTWSCGPSSRTPLGGAWVEEWQGPILAEAGGHRLRLLRKRLIGYRVVDEYVTRPRYYPGSDCIIYEQFSASELRVVCGDGTPRVLLTEPRKFGEQGELMSDWQTFPGGVFKRAQAGEQQTKCITLQAARAVATGAPVAITECTVPPEPSASTGAPQPRP